MSNKIYSIIIKYPRGLLPPENIILLKLNYNSFFSFLLNIIEATRISVNKKSKKINYCSYH